MFCSKCGKELFDEAVVCPNCGVPTSKNQQPAPMMVNPTVKEKLEASTADYNQTKNVFKMVQILNVITVLVLGGIVLGSTAIDDTDHKILAIIIASVLALISEIASIAILPKINDLYFNNGMMQTEIITMKKQLKRNLIGIPIMILCILVVFIAGML